MRELKKRHNFKTVIHQKEILKAYAYHSIISKHYFFSHVHNIFHILKMYKLKYIYIHVYISFLPVFSICP
jgi:hypothetical protein